MVLISLRQEIERYVGIWTAKWHVACQLNFACLDQISQPVEECDLPVISHAISARPSENFASDETYLGYHFISITK